MEKPVFSINKVDLSQFNNDWYSPGASLIKRTIWYGLNTLILMNPFNPISRLKILVLRIFGAKIGKGVVIKPGVSIKYPWYLTVGDNVWIGENVWIDNLALIRIGDNVTISQGALLLTGSHDYKTIRFDLIVKTIMLEEGVWIGAKSTVCPGVICHSHSVLSVGSVATKNLEPYGIYQGIPAEKKRERAIK